MLQIRSLLKDQEMHQSDSCSIYLGETINQLFERSEEITQTPRSPSSFYGFSNGGHGERVIQ